MSFTADGTLRDIQCVNSFPLPLPGAAGSYRSSPDLDQRSGFDGFRHHCDVAGNVARQQGFTPSRTGTLSSASVTAFQNGSPNAPLALEVVDAADGTVLGRKDFPVGAVPWAPTALAAHPDVAVTAGHPYLLRLRSATTSGCYGWEYNDGNPYPAGGEAYSVDNSRSFTAEPLRDLKFSTDVSATPVFAPDGVPAGFARCADESGRCAFTGTRVVAYGAGTSYRFRTTADGVDCAIAAFGGDPLVGTRKACYTAPDGGPSGFSSCAGENGTCSVDGPAVVAYGAVGAFTYRLVGKGDTACTNVAFGGDPVHGVAKGCYAATGSGPPGTTACASENGTCAPGSARTVVYGARGAFVTRWATGPLPCTSAAFGTDPIPGVVKGCYLV